MSNTKMTMEQLQTITMTTGKLLESPTEEFIAYVESLPLGELLGLKNYLEAEYERVRQMKDMLIKRVKDTQNKSTKVTETVEGLYKILAVIENRHGIILQFIESKRGEN